VYFDLDYPVRDALIHWSVVMVGVTLLAMAISYVGAIASLGFAKGTKTFAMMAGLGVEELFVLAPRRILAITILTVKESVRRKALMVGGVFLLLFMFAGWFLRSSEADTPAKPYVAFVFTTTKFVLFPLTLILACWGLPADIKDRSIHTVVTKPVKRSEVVLGRIFGYAFLVTVIVAVVALIGYVWLLREVPAASKDQLIARVPVFGTASYLDRQGQPARSGVNVGDIWAYRSFIEGATKARALWQFPVSEKSLHKTDAGEELWLEQKFEAFRTYKGVIDEQVRFSLTFVNPTTGLRVPGDAYEVFEFEASPTLPLMRVNRTLDYRPIDQPNAEPEKIDLIDKLVDNGKLTVEVACEDASQFIGTAQKDLFIRMPDRPFSVAYFKGMLGIWLLLMMIVLIGTTGSTFLKGPVGTMMTLGISLIGITGLRGFMSQQLLQFTQSGQVLGGGTLESLYRIVTWMNQQSPLPDNLGTRIIKFIDRGIFRMLELMNGVLPDLSRFDAQEYVANGFDVPFNNAVLPSILTLIGFFIPCYILGYFALRLRELEAK
jgi:hypothetical protein